MSDDKRINIQYDDGIQDTRRPTNDTILVRRPMDREHYVLIDKENERD